MLTRGYGEPCYVWPKLLEYQETKDGQSSVLVALPNGERVWLLLDPSQDRSWRQKCGGIGHTLRTLVNPSWAKHLAKGLLRK